MLQKDAAILSDFQKAIDYEWLETNGIGGFSSSTIIGCNTRRYHGLLVAATHPPGERMNLVNKLDETIIFNNTRYELGVNDYGNTVSPNGNQYLQSFEKGLFPAWEFNTGDIRLKKTVAMIHGSNSVLIRYEVTKAPETFQIEFLPLLSVRGYHELMHANDFVRKEFNYTGGLFSMSAYDNTPRIFISIPGAEYRHQPLWYYHFNYTEEKNRGLDFVEDLFNPGHFTVTLQPNSQLEIMLSTDNPSTQNIPSLFNRERTRREHLLPSVFDQSSLHYLLLAADQFIVNRDEHNKTVIAGYHWFTDWGRDTMIALPGLCLSTGRYEDARNILRSFAQFVSEGMLPNCFPDHHAAPGYNQVDATLWYFAAVYKYLQASGDKEFILGEMLPVLKEIINWHIRGTRFNIKMDEKGLLYAGEAGWQLTWMDARSDGRVITPRMGRPVEVQALWYNALKIMAAFLRLNKEEPGAADFDKMSAKTFQSFQEIFWNEEEGSLFDNIDENDHPDASVRPNQVFALSLPFPLITGTKAGKMINTLTNKLYTPMGLRSLDPSSPAFVASYEGDAAHRDAAYHQGTVWLWLLGPYIDALVQQSGTNREAQQVIDRFRYHLQEAGIGTASEIADAVAPYHARGCIAQAWSVAELLRVLKDYNLH